MERWTASVELVPTMSQRTEHSNTPESRLSDSISHTRSAGPCVRSAFWVICLAMLASALSAACVPI